VRIAIASVRHRTGGSDEATVIVNWLKTDHGLGHGHAMAIVQLIKQARAQAQARA
jgi:hypothetical protein